MVSSPGLVIYAELLLLVQYVYGLQLTDDELPLQDPTGTFDYSELGLKKWQFPCLHLGAQVKLYINSTSMDEVLCIVDCFTNHGWQSHDLAVSPFRQFDAHLVSSGIMRGECIESNARLYQ